MKGSCRTLTRWQHCRQQAHPNLKQRCDSSFTSQELTRTSWRVLQITAPLRDLIKQGHLFSGHLSARAFEQTRTLLLGDTVMAYFDPHRKTKLMTDAGTHGLAVTLKQYDPHARWWRPVTYRSRTLTDTEMRYLQIEKEAKAVEWGMLAIQIY